MTPRGRKVFLVMYRLAGAGSRLRKYTIGPYGRITLPMARAQAQKIFAARLDGRDPAEEKKQSRRRLVVDRIDDLIEAFIHEHISQTVSRNRISNLLRRDVLPHWGAKSVHEIKKRDVSDLIGLISQRNPHAGHRLLKTLKTFFRWCVGRAVIDFSPVEGLSSGYRESSRDRVLTDQELATIIVAARQMPPPYGGVVELLALTGQRRQEVSKLKWDEPTRNRGLGPFPVREPRTRRHTSFTCQSPRGKSSRNVGTYLFGTSGAKHFQAYSTSKRALDTLSGITGCRPHDRRRTIVSGMARLGVPPHVADKILNHQAGTIPV